MFIRYQSIKRLEIFHYSSLLPTLRYQCMHVKVLNLHNSHMISSLGGTGSSCYSCVLSKTRREQEFSVMSYEKYFQPTLHEKFGDNRRQQQHKLWPKDRFLSLRVKCLHFRKFTLRQKCPATNGIWHNRKMKYTCSIYWYNQYCLGARGFDWHACLV